MNLTLHIENILLIGSLLLFISVIAGRTSYKFGVPTLVLFLAIGMLAGSEGVGGIHFDDPKIAQFIGIVSLNFILFFGGLDTDKESIKPILWQGIALSSVGVVLTALTLGAFVWMITNFSLYEALLLGAIVSSTDAAAVFSILRSKSLALSSNLRSTLELESGSNDPMAYVLVVAFLGLILHPEHGIFSIVLIFFKQLIIGVAGGFVFAKLSHLTINNIRLDFEGLYFVLVVALMFITFAATDVIGGNGFLAVYLCAVYLGNKEFIHKKTILKMFDGVAWLMQIVLFLTLGLLVFPSRVVSVLEIGLLVSLFLMVFARPISIALCLLPFRIAPARIVFVSWVGLRGAVPIVFATYPLLAGIAKADIMFNIVFFISLSSVLVQGTTLTLVAKWLGLALPDNVPPRRTGLDMLLADSAKHLMEEIILSANSAVIGKKIVDVNFPKNSLIAMIIRGTEYITPSGATELQEHDILVVLSENKESLCSVYQCLGSEIPPPQAQTPPNKL